MWIIDLAMEYVAFPLPREVERIVDSVHPGGTSKKFSSSDVSFGSCGRTRRATRK